MYVTLMNYELINIEHKNEMILKSLHVKSDVLKPNLSLMHALHFCSQH